MSSTAPSAPIEGVTEGAELAIDGPHIRARQAEVAYANGSLRKLVDPATAGPVTELVIARIIEPDQHPAKVYIARLGKRSRRVMRQSLDSIAALVSGGLVDAEGLFWSKLRYQHTAAIRSKLAEQHSPATANRMLAALRGVLKEAWKLGQMSAEEYHRATEIAPVKGETLPRGRALNDGELRALFGVCVGDRTAAGARDAAMLAVLYGGGLRRSEAVQLDVADYNTETGELTVRHGKGNKARVVYATHGGKRAINAWLRVRGDDDGALLCPVNRGGNVQHRRMSDQAVLGILRKRAKQAGVPPFSPHDCRRSFISHLLDAGADISTVQSLAGHANVTTTQRYDRRGEVTKRKAAELLHVPYDGDDGVGEVKP